MFTWLGYGQSQGGNGAENKGEKPVENAKDNENLDNNKDGDKNVQEKTTQEKGSTNAAQKDLDYKDVAKNVGSK